MIVRLPNTIILCVQGSFSNGDTVVYCFVDCFVYLRDHRGGIISFYTRGCSNWCRTFVGQECWDSSSSCGVIFQVIRWGVRSHHGKTNGSRSVPCVSSLSTWVGWRNTRNAAASNSVVPFAVVVLIGRGASTATLSCVTRKWTRRNTRTAFWRESLGNLGKPLKLYSNWTFRHEHKDAVRSTQKTAIKQHFIYSPNLITLFLFL